MPLATVASKWPEELASQAVWAAAAGANATLTRFGHIVRPLFASTILTLVVAYIANALVLSPRAFAKGVEVADSVVLLTSPLVRPFERMIQLASSACINVIILAYKFGICYVFSFFYWGLMITTAVQAGFSATAHALGVAHFTVIPPLVSRGLKESLHALGRHEHSITAFIISTTERGSKMSQIVKQQGIKGFFGAAPVKAALASLIIVAPIREELIFRGVFQSMVRRVQATTGDAETKKSRNFRFAVIAFVFSLSHLPNHYGPIESSRDLAMKFIDATARDPKFDSRGASMNPQAVQTLVWPVIVGLAQCCVAFWASFRVYSPIFERRGLVASISAHATWNVLAPVAPLVAFGPWALCKAWRVVATLAQRANGALRRRRAQRGSS